MMNGYVEKNCEFFRRRNDNCAFIVSEIQNVALGCIYYCPTCGEDFRLSRENLADSKFCRCPVCDALIEFGEAKEMSLADYFNKDFAFYHIDDDMNYNGVELVLHRGAEMYILDTRQGTVRNAAGGEATIDVMFAISEIDALYRCAFEEKYSEQR